MSSADATLPYTSTATWGERNDAAENAAPLAALGAAIPERIFWAFTSLHVLLWTLMPALTHPNRPLDMVEMLYWGHAWQWGYYKHPPLPAWIAEAVFQVSFGAVWPLYLVGQLAVAASFWAAWKLAQQFVRPWPALCASVLLEACSYYNLTTADINNSIILQPLWALSVFWFYRALRSHELRYWAATGVGLGLGMLAKYDMAVLILSMIAFGLANRQARCALRSPGPYLTLAISLLIFLPHLAWMIQCGFPTVQYAVDRAENSWSWLGHVINPAEFLVSQLIAHLPMLAVALPVFWKAGTWRQARPTRDTFKRDFLITICLGPFLLDLILSAISGAKLQSMWGASMWTFSGLGLMWIAGRAADRRACRRMVLGCAAAGCLVLLVVTARSTVFPYLRGTPSRVHYPGAQLADIVEGTWRRKTDLPLTVVAGSWWPAANVALFSHSRPQVYDLLRPNFSPWADDHALQERGGMIVWERDADAPALEQAILGRFPAAEIQSSFELRWQTGADIAPLRFGLAMIPPAARTANARRR